MNTEIGCSSLKIQALPPSMHYKWEEILRIVYANQTIENQRELTPDGKIKLI